MREVREDGAGMGVLGPSSSPQEVCVRLLWKCPFLFADRFKQALLSVSKITADGDCSHEIKRRLPLERKVMTNLDSIFKSGDITLPKKVCLVKAMVFPQWSCMDVRVGL